MATFPALLGGGGAGAPGPAGPTGPAGPAGPKGDPGDAGSGQIGGMRLLRPGNAGFLVPAGVTRVRIQMRAAGGRGEGDGSGSAQGGQGGYVDFVLTVTPGETLTTPVGSASASFASDGRTSRILRDSGTTLLAVAYGGADAAGPTSGGAGGEAYTYTAPGPSQGPHDLTITGRKGYPLGAHYENGLAPGDGGCGFGSSGADGLTLITY